MGVSEPFCIYIVPVQSLGLSYTKSNFRCLQRNMLHIPRNVVAFGSMQICRDLYVTFWNKDWCTHYADALFGINKNINLKARQLIVERSQKSLKSHW